MNRRAAEILYELKMETAFSPRNRCTEASHPVPIQFNHLMGRRKTSLFDVEQTISLNLKRDGRWDEQLKKHSSHPFPHLLVGNSLVSVYEAMGIVVGESHRIASPLLRGHEYSCSLLKAGLTDCKQTKILRLCISRNNSAEKNDELSTCIQPKKESAVHGEEGEGIV